MVVHCLLSVVFLLPSASKQVLSCLSTGDLSTCNEVSLGFLSNHAPMPCDWTKTSDTNRPKNIVSFGAATRPNWFWNIATPQIQIKSHRINRNSFPFIHIHLPGTYDVNGTTSSSYFILTTAVLCKDTGKTSLLSSLLNAPSAVIRNHLSPSF